MAAPRPATDPEGASRFVESAAFGIGEFDGYVTDTCLTKRGKALNGGMIAWSDWKSLESFRHSELYAKLLMSPLFEDVTDRAFYVDEGATPVMMQSELLAVA